MTLRPPRRPFSVSRQLSERARAVSQPRATTETADATETSGFAISGFDGVTGMFGALRGLVEQLAASAQQQAKDTEPHNGGFSAGGDKVRMVFGYTLKMGTDGISAEPFGDVPAGRTPTAKPSADRSASVMPAPLQPIVEMYQDGAAVVVIAELPGADPDRIVCRAEGVSLLIEAAGVRNYRKELTLPVAVRPDGLVQTLRNGILEVRLLQAATP